MRQGQHGSQGMRQGQQNKRMRGRGRKMPNQLNRVYESNGPDVKVRGNAAHIAEKYVSLARDAQSSGDWVSAENYLQHAEHYFRIVAAAQAQTQPQQGHDGDDDDDAAPVSGGASRDMTESDQEAADALAQPELQPQPQARSRRRRANGHETRSGADDAQPAADEARASGTPDGQAALAQVNGTAASAEAAGGTQPDAAADQPAEQSAEQPV